MQAWEAFEVLLTVNVSIVVLKDMAVVVEVIPLTDDEVTVRVLALPNRYPAPEPTKIATTSATIATAPLIPAEVIDGRVGFTPTLQNGQDVEFLMAVQLVSRPRFQTSLNGSVIHKTLCQGSGPFGAMRVQNRSHRIRIHGLRSLASG